MQLEHKLSRLTNEIDAGLQDFLAGLDFGHSPELQQMLRYHMGWEDDLGGGKRLRPMITLLCAGASGGDYGAAMPAALAIEFLHNFTLIHDDIEDHSATRHGRATLWTRWGIAQAINAGDALFSIAQLALLDLEKTCSESVVIQAVRELNRMCLHLTRGQYLDIAFERDEGVHLETYLAMIQGKTAALIAYSSAMGGLAAGANGATVSQLGDFGQNLGMAFQIQDDFLGIWGDPAVTGKSAASDLLARKKSLPVLFGLRESAEFCGLWRKKTPTSAQIKTMAVLLEECGAADYVRDQAAYYINQAYAGLAQLFPDQNNDAKVLAALTKKLLHRQM